jgi:DNA-binding GntR family transcriptional regulator
MTHSFMSACSRAIWKNRLERVLATASRRYRNKMNREEIMSTENVKLVMELDRQLMAALTRMDEVAASALMADGVVWTYVNARVLPDCRED